jgi:hypothetical protein
MRVHLKVTFFEANGQEGGSLGEIDKIDRVYHIYVALDSWGGDRRKLGI